jgi:ribosomal protein L31|uniref:Large ribosomal subunit protein bL31c n=1 Tax=Eutreptiella gymnastica TaxID=73025 RepID=A0A7S4G8G4_9EUGL|eukprot:CAMPEP_0174282212 /NCGR_PEP_ID=MMETSP0809-20121228/2685_1 /TAXON_ID=73025 ORGANISM="Eutreptiella gymnastica-like, Strain CCMP1594" /NCGR_SAMPLE_ID=MMETSP0809 /ASSEMBLY_ACC=CAM_ASM_000658 /LENGTH=245 /DNA_ID=CAMNT_0015376253 /DNA_START=30 /DNA_END=767 /DNA_ORIENTATION=-
MDAKQSTCAAVIGISIGVIAFVSFNSVAQSSATSLVASVPTTARPVTVAAATRPTFVEANVNQNFEASLYNSAQNAEEAAAQYEYETVSLPASQESWAWRSLLVLGLIPAAVVAAVSVLRRQTQGLVTLEDVEAGARPFQYNTTSPFRGTSVPGRASLALSAKKDIHPEYFEEAKVYCGGEHVFTTSGSQEKYVVDIWSGNHPFYKKDGGPLIADAGRVDRFKNKYGSLGGLGEVPGAGGAKEEK